MEEVTLTKGNEAVAHAAVQSQAMTDTSVIQSHLSRK